MSSWPFWKRASSVSRFFCGTSPDSTPTRKPARSRPRATRSTQTLVFTNTIVRWPSLRVSRPISSGIFSSSAGKYTSWRTLALVMNSDSTTSFSGSFMCS